MSTIKDVARKANVSVTTVSRVLNNNGYVHQDTKKNIERAISELNYSPNAFAEGLSKGTIKTIGVLIDNITNSTTNRLIEHIELLSQKNGYKVILGITRNSYALEQYYLNMFKKYNVDGMILSNKPILINDFISLNKPIVSIDNLINNDIPSVNINYDQGAKLAALELINNNCSNILIIKYDNETDKKIKSFVAELNNHEIEYKIKSFSNDFDKDHLFNFLSENTFDGIYTTCDLLALSTVSSLQKLKVKVPDKCCIIGFDNSSFANIINPSLSSIDYPIEIIANDAFNIVHSNIKENNKIIDHRIIDVILVKRESTQKNDN